MVRENIIVEDFIENGAEIGESVATLTRLKKLKTSASKFMILDAIKSDLVQEVEETPVVEQEEVVVEEPVVEEHVEVQQPVYSFEQPKVEKEVVVPEEKPVYSFEQPNQTAYKENKLASRTFDYSTLNAMNSTEKFQRDYEIAQGRVEKQVLRVAVRTLKEKDVVIDTKKRELEEILRQEQEIKTLREQKSKEIETSINDKKETVTQMEEAVSRAKQIDNLAKMEEEKRRQAEEEQAQLAKQREKLMSQFPFSFEEEPEKKPIAKEEKKEIVNNHVEDNYDAIRRAREFISRISIDTPYVEERNEGLGRAA